MSARAVGRRLAAPVLAISCVSLIVFDIVHGLPPLVLIGGFALIFILALETGRLFETPRNAVALRPLEFVVKSKAIMLTDEFHFSKGRTIEVPNGRYRVACEPAGTRAFGRALITCVDGATVELQDAFALTVRYGLVYVADAQAGQDTSFQHAAQQIISGAVATPVAVELAAEAEPFGVAFEIGRGNGVHRVMIDAAGVIVVAADTPSSAA